MGETLKRNTHRSFGFVFEKHSGRHWCRLAFRRSLVSSPRVSLWRSAGSFPEQRLVIEPRTDLVIMWCHRFQKGPSPKWFPFKLEREAGVLNSPGLQSVFNKALRFRDGLVWTVGLTLEIKLRFQSYILHSVGGACVIAGLGTIGAVKRYFFLILYICQGIHVTSIMAYLGSASLSVIPARKKCTEWECATGSSAVTMATPQNE